MSFPPPIMMSQPGSFAHHTLTQRWPAIVRRVIAENSFSDKIVRNLETLLQDLAEGRVRTLQDEAAPDLAVWQHYLEPMLGLPWLGIPWFFAEVYFYRRLLEATEYFQIGDWQGIDPFQQQKQAGLQAALSNIHPLVDDLRQIEATDHRLLQLLYSGLWGNRVDLSLQPHSDALELQREVSNSTQNHILIDDTAVILVEFSRQPLARIDLIADNAGFELACDLLLVEMLLSQSLTQTVVLHLKNHPTFVSDATIPDLETTLSALASNPKTQAVAKQLQQYRTTGQLQITADPFWTSPLVLWEMPIPLQQSLAQADLVILKGDANYRRLLGDRHWPFTVQFAAIVRYFPTSLITLRTLKSEIIAGLTVKQMEFLSHHDPNWLTNGKWGVIQSWMRRNSGGG